MSDAYLLGEEFTKRAQSFRQPMYIVAHHDDEIPTAGLLQRLGHDTKVLYLTNSDGLYYESKLTPAEYGELRKQEGFKSLLVIGIPKENVINCDFSEVEIYRRLAWLHSGAKRIEDVIGFFEQMRDAVHKAVFEVRPDVVFTQAWQGGQPEHDLAHFFAALAIQDYCRKTGERVEFFQLPAYEYTILIAMRFHPFYKGIRMRLRLTETELTNKLRMIEAYPSQVRLFGDFRRVFRYASPVWRLFGGPATMEEMLSIEEFGPVPEGIDYTKSTHLLDCCNYIGDDFEGTPVTFRRSIRPIVKALLGFI